MKLQFWQQPYNNTKIQIIDKNKYDRNSYPAPGDRKILSNRPEACVVSSSKRTHFKDENSGLTPESKFTSEV